MPALGADTGPPALLPEPAGQPVWPPHGGEHCQSEVVLRHGISPGVGNGQYHKFEGMIKLNNTGFLTPKTEKAYASPADVSTRIHAFSV